MPRKARIKNNTKVFHVMIQGINQEYIFDEDVEKKTYLKYLKEKIKDKDLQMISYCIMSNHAHFLIYTDDVIQISKLMSQVNTKYAIYYNQKHNRCGFVFRSRYKAEEIVSYHHFLSCINYIHNNPVKAQMCKTPGEYKYSSYNEYKEKEILINKNKIIQIFKKYYMDISDIFNGKYEAYRFIEHEESNNIEEIKNQIIENFLINNKMKSINDIIYNKKFLKDIVTQMYIEYNFNQTEIARALGVERTKINKMINKA